MKSLYPLVMALALAAFAGAGLAGVLAAWRVAVVLLALGGMALVAVTHLRVRAAMALVKRTSAALAKPIPTVALADGTAEVLADKLVPLIDARVMASERNAARIVNSSESIVLADLLTLRQQLARNEALLQALSQGGAAPEPGTEAAPAGRTSGIEIR